MAKTPFQIAVPDDVLTDLRRRLELTRWPDAVEDAGWVGEKGALMTYGREGRPSFDFKRT